MAASTHNIHVQMLASKLLKIILHPIRFYDKSLVTQKHKQQW